MNTRKKKILIISSSMIFVGAIITGLSCAYFLSPSIERITNKGIYVYRQNTSLSSYGYKYDTSATSGSTISNQLGVIINADLLHLKSEGKFLADSSGNIIQPSYQSYEFSIADSIVLKFKNSNTNEMMELSFNSDDAEIKGNDHKSTIIEKDSNNPFSINNHKIFQSLISIGALKGNKINNASEIESQNIIASGEWKLRQLGFTIKPGVKWIDHNGKQTKYDVVAKDFWYSFMRTKLFDRQYRRNNGGSKELDSYFIKKTKAINRFNESDRYSNEYLFSFFDIDSTKLYDEENVITKTNDGRDLFTFTALDNVDRPTGFSSVLKKFFVNSFTFSAAPSQYIDELAKNEKLNNISNDIKIQGAARKFGIYTYGQTRESTFYAGRYIPASAAREQREVFTYNKYFANEKWVEMVEKGKINDDGKKTKALNTIIFEYSGGIDTSTYNSQLLSSYMKGIVSEIKYSDLTIDQREKIWGSSSNYEDIENNANKNGLQYTKTINISTFVQRTLVQSNPTNGIDINSYGFGEEYSKLVFGLTRKELSEGKMNTTDAFFINSGFEFRLLIQAAINWYTFINQTYQNQRVMWLNGTAQDAQFSSVNQNSGRPIDFFEEVNTLQFIDRTSGNPQLVSITPEEMKQYANQNPDDQIKSMQSPKFELIQKNMKLLLDNNNIKKINGIIDWSVVYPWDNKDTIKTTVLEYVVNTINKLDNRLGAKLIIPKNRDELLPLISQNKGVDDFNGWSYDYEGIGSYISAFSNNHGVTIFNAFAIYTMDDSNDPRYEKVQLLKQMFPQFTKLAQFIKKYMDNEMKRLQIEEKYWIKNWDKITNTANQDLTEYFQKETNGKFDPAVSMPKALKTYEEEPLSDKEWATLIKELNAIKGVSINADNSIPDPNTATLSLYLKEYIIPLTKYGISYFCDYQTIENE